MLIPQTNTWQPGFQKRTIKKELKVGPVSLKFITAALVAVGLLLYLAQSTAISSKKYQNRQLGEQTAKLKAETRDLEVQAARARSLKAIQDDSVALGFESAN